MLLYSCDKPYDTELYKTFKPRITICDEGPSVLPEYRAQPEQPKFLVAEAPAPQEQPNSEKPFDSGQSHHPMKPQDDTALPRRSARTMLKSLIDVDDSLTVNTTRPRPKSADKPKKTPKKKAKPSK